MQPQKPIVLVIDDSPDDLTLMEMAAKKIAADVEWRSIDNGPDALSYLTGEGTYSNRAAHPVPHLLLLDLKMPRVSGFDILTKLKESGAKKPPYICVLTSSGLKEDIDKATALGADVFHTKPPQFDDLCEMLTRLTQFFCLSNRNRLGPQFS